MYGLRVFIRVEEKKKCSCKSSYNLEGSQVRRHIFLVSSFYNRVVSRRPRSLVSESVFYSDHDLRRFFGRFFVSTYHPVFLPTAVNDPCFFAGYCDRE